MTDKPVFSTILAVSALTLASSQAFLFDDGTFETAIPSLEDGSGWEAFGTPDVASAISREDWANGAPGIGGSFGYASEGDGQYGMVFRGFSGTAGGFYHDVPVEAGRTYDFHIQSHAASEFWAEIDFVAESKVLISFEWYDGDPTDGGVLIGAVENDISGSLIDGGSDLDIPPGPSLVANWQDWNYTGLTPPGGSAYLRVIIEWTASAVLSGGDEAMRWDNAQLTTSLDPINDSVSTVAQPRLSFDSQAGVTYTVEKSPDITSGFTDAGEEPLVGTGAALERVFGMSGADREFYRLSGTPNFSDGQVRVYPASPQVGDAGWQGFMNVFNLPADGGGYIFGSAWGIDDLVSDISSATTVMTLSPNTIGDPNEFWYQNTTGTAPDPTNPGGPGQKGNKMMEANLFMSFTDTALSGTTVTFSGTVQGNTLTSAHTARAFIKDFSPDFGSVSQTAVDLTPGPFTVSLITDPGAGRHVQCGFVMVGENVWITDTAPFGNVQVAVEPFVFDETDLLLDEGPGSVVIWDGQLGVHYLAQYSDNAGTDWTNLGAGEVVGAGAALQVLDPAGVVSGRTYRVIVAPAVPLVPAP